MVGRLFTDLLVELDVICPGATSVPGSGRRDSALHQTFGVLILGELAAGCAADLLIQANHLRCHFQRFPLFDVLLSGQR